ncbi:putative periplasmic protein [Xenorhabdus poinarii G6]|uniref:Putative periplasmic protein n=1 Tax=Xenorhabdus poinarii G6 TaxID=1354304 RepID=A0A068QZH7_9GAMM|nr:SGNH family hydrolase [Xenorhabdus poinarii]CDG20189.1 putative periplasmic protein [Xenorhabdus poinarii G6]
MPTSEFTANLKKVGQTICIMLLSSLILIWLNQGSLDNFWQQKYHRNSPWVSLKGETWWDLGDNLHQGAIAAGETFMAYAQGKYQDNALSANHNDNHWKVFPPEFQVGLRFLQGYLYPVENLSVTFPELLNKETKLIPPPLLANQPAKNPIAEIIQKAQVNLRRKDKVLFAGDSMMQGIAPYLKRRLSQEYGITSINLSKQSTGLSYPGFFDWPKTISDTLSTYPDIKLVMIFLGPNDPWDMPSGRGGAYVKFASEHWETLYRQRIETILTAARQHKVDVIWVGPPNMRQKTLSTNMVYLNELYQTEVEKMGEIFVAVNDMFKYQSNHYSDYLGDGSSPLKLRSGDGIHFTPRGQQTIADYLFSLITLIQEPVKEDATT